MIFYDQSDFSRHNPDSSILFDEISNHIYESVILYGKTGFIVKNQFLNDTDVKTGYIDFFRIIRITFKTFKSHIRIGFISGKKIIIEKCIRSIRIPDHIKVF